MDSTTRFSTFFVQNIFWAPFLYSQNINCYFLYEKVICKSLIFFSKIYIYFAIVKEELRKKDRKEERINETNRK